MQRKSGDFLFKSVDLSEKMCYNYYEMIFSFFDRKPVNLNMKYLGEFLSYILIAVFAQNLLLSRAVGMDGILTATGHRRSLIRLLVLVGCWSTAGIMLMWMLSRFVTDMDDYLTFALLHSLICAVAYFASDRLLARLKPRLYESWGEVMPHALINAIVVGAPLSALASGIPSWYAALGYGIGSALGLGLGVVIIRNGQDILDHPDVPQAFRGIPIMLIYIGILSLGFCAFL